MALSNGYLKYSGGAAETYKQRSAMNSISVLGDNINGFPTPSFWVGVNFIVDEMTVPDNTNTNAQANAAMLRIIRADDYTPIVEVGRIFYRDGTNGFYKNGNLIDPTRVNGNAPSGGLFIQYDRPTSKWYVTAWSPSGYHFQDDYVSDFVDTEAVGLLMQIEFVKEIGSALTSRMDRFRMSVTESPGVPWWICPSSSSSSQSSSSTSSSSSSQSSSSESSSSTSLSISSSSSSSSTSLIGSSSSSSSSSSTSVSSSKAPR